VKALRPFQREDVEFIKANNLNVLIASAPGTGKTVVALRALVESPIEYSPALVVCPASVTRNWAKEIRRWAPNYRPIIIDDMDTRLTKQPRQTVYIISWNLLDTRWMDLVRVGVQTLIADEAHYAKNPDALRSQALLKIAENAKGVLLLTGTPIVNTEQELHVLNTLFGGQPAMLRRLLEDVAPDIPEKTRSYLNIELRPKHRAEYDKAMNDFETWLREEKQKLVGEGLAEAEVERILAAEALAKIGYLRRLVGTFKVPAASDWIARAVRLGEPVVVFAEHQATVRKLSKALHRQRIRHAILEGSTSNKQRQEIIDGFQQHKFPVFIGTKAAKEGITLTAARHLLFVERFFTAADEEQAEDRIRRIGQTQKTTIWFLHAVNTVDERIDTIVRTKRKVVREAIGSADIQETPETAVQQMIHSWSHHVQGEDVETLQLGLGEPLPPLPQPRTVHAILFYGKRWNKDTAATWCQMNGYLPHKIQAFSDKIKVILTPVELFVKNRFSLEPVSRDIRILLGQRMSAPNERQVRQHRKLLRS
jgi:SNF2 family DNA or RNA helicase